MNALTAEAVAMVDASSMLADVLDQPAQLRDALWRVEAADLSAREAPGGLVVCGMGGSAIGGDLASAAIGARAMRPIRTVRGYAPDSWVGEETLVLCASYSGNTEETLACFEAAGSAGARRIAVTTGGKLAEAARASGVPVIGIPAGLQPRAAVAYMVVAVLECAAVCGAAPALRSEIEAASTLLAGLASEWGPAAEEDAQSKALAHRLHGAIPVVYGAAATEPVALRWKTQLNENAKLPAFWAALPEADHNELCGWEGAAALASFFAVFLDDPEIDARLRRRIEPTSDVVAAGAAGTERVEARGATALERVLSLVLLGDLVSVYLAVLAGLDPTPVESIERFKRAIA